MLYEMLAVVVVVTAVRVVLVIDDAGWYPCRIAQFSKKLAQLFSSDQNANYLALQKLTDVIQLGLMLLLMFLNLNLSVVLFRGKNFGTVTVLAVLAKVTLKIC